MSNAAVRDAPLLAQYLTTRRATAALCGALENEDFGLQGMTEASPPKWHLAHTTWFFESFILKPLAEAYRPYDPAFEYLFNSYYNGVGPQYPRGQRGLLSRPTVRQVFAYREHVDAAMSGLLSNTGHAEAGRVQALCELGLHHEQQHQELLCTDIKYSFSLNPLFPAMREVPPADVSLPPGAMAFVDQEAADVWIGHRGDGFHFDNEAPAHPYRLPSFRFANRLVSNGEFLEFVQDGGYRTPTLWLSDGWTWCRSNTVSHPLYWRERDGAWFEYTLHGLIPLCPQAPLLHVNYYEADAFARWMGRRLPTEQEWESVCMQRGLEPAHRPVALHPVAGSGDDEVRDMFDCLWQWTGSAYSAYPGYRPPVGAVGEYNGKFMCNQLVLRGSSCLTAPGHARVSYRNFFYPQDRWQFTGIRLADDL
jgi:ergothioneine biosynthesis protein EgtB